MKLGVCMSHWEEPRDINAKLVVPILFDWLWLWLATCGAVDADIKELLAVVISSSIQRVNQYLSAYSSTNIYTLYYIQYYNVVFKTQEWVHICQMPHSTKEPNCVKNIATQGMANPNSKPELRLHTPPKFNSSPLKNGGWKTTFLLGRSFSRGLC